MRVEEIVVGKTYEGRYGHTRKVVGLKDGVVTYHRGNTAFGFNCWIYSFSRWAVREATNG